MAVARFKCVRVDTQMDTYSSVVSMVVTYNQR